MTKTLKVGVNGLPGSAIFVDTIDLGDKCVRKDRSFSAGGGGERGNEFDRLRCGWEDLDLARTRTPFIKRK